LERLGLAIANARACSRGFIEEGRNDVDAQLVAYAPASAVDATQAKVPARLVPTAFRGGDGRTLSRMADRDRAIDRRFARV
jgi:hypothetical protein